MIDIREKALDKLEQERDKYAENVSDNPKLIVWRAHELFINNMLISVIEDEFNYEGEEEQDRLNELADFILAHPAPLAELEKHYDINGSAFATLEKDISLYAYYRANGLLR